MANGMYEKGTQAGQLSFAGCRITIGDHFKLAKGCGRANAVKGFSSSRGIGLSHSLFIWLNGVLYEVT